MRRIDLNQLWRRLRSLEAADPRREPDSPDAAAQKARKRAATALRRRLSTLMRQATA
jgi:hypothetical protein